MKNTKVRRGNSLIQPRSSIFLITLMFSMVMLFGLASASDYLPHKQNTELQFSLTSNNASSCNVTTLDRVSGVVNINQIMTKNLNTFNSTINADNFSSLGSYCFNIVCTDGLTFETGSVCREVSVTGKELTSAKATSYTIILIISILVFIGVLYFGIAMPSGNNKDEMTGYILAISNLKYLKYLFLALSYVCLIWITYFIWMVIYAYLDFDFLSNIFKFMFFFLLAGALPLFIIYCYLNISNLVRDSKIGDSLQRGLRTK